MSKTILKDVSFTPTIDTIVKKEGLITAAVFGRVWRYCQMKDHVCNASKETIAKELGISDRTVKRHIKILVRHGYLTDMTPDLKNIPHTYKDTGKAAIKIEVETDEFDLDDEWSDDEE